MKGVRTQGLGLNPSGVCQCGCGERTPLSPRSNRHRGAVKGEPLRFIHGHQSRVKRVPPPPEPPPGGWALARAAKIKRFKRNPVTGCWLWLGSRTEKGYGRIRFRGEWWSAHRLSYEQHVGPIPEGMQLDHLCEHPRCINPAHLEPVTGLENMRRARGAA